MIQMGGDDSCNKSQCPSLSLSSLFAGVFLSLRCEFIINRCRAHQTHYEQFGIISGEVKIEGHGTRQVQLRGVRDHSYGRQKLSCFSFMPTCTHPRTLGHRKCVFFSLRLLGWRL